MGLAVGSCLLECLRDVRHDPPLGAAIERDEIGADSKPPGRRSLSEEVDELGRTRVNVELWFRGLNLAAALHPIHPGVEWVGEGTDSRGSCCLLVSPTSSLRGFAGGGVCPTDLVRIILDVEAPI